MRKYIIISLFGLFSCGEYVNETIEVNEIKTSTSSIFLKEVTWGLTGDSKLLYIGFSKDIKDTSFEMRYNMPEYFLYKFENDTLFTYVRSPASMKENFIKKYQLKETILGNVEMMDLIRVSDERGLKKFLEK